jgi:hypothetical protein
MGVRGSYNDGAKASAFLDAVNRVLIQSGVTPYLDPPEPPNVYKGHLFGRSDLDHHTSRVLAEIARRGTQSMENPNLALIRDNPYRVAFVPADFVPPRTHRVLRANWRRGHADLGWLVATSAHRAKAACWTARHSAGQWRTCGRDRLSHQRLRAAPEWGFCLDRGRKNCLACVVRRSSAGTGTSGRSDACGVSES